MITTLILTATSLTAQNAFPSSGNVGIGTTNPQSRLEIKNGGQGLHFLTGSNSSGYALSIGVNDDGVNFSNNSTVRGFNFKNTYGSLMTITNYGKVGIGTTNPDSKLTVKGKIHAEEVKIDLSVPAPDYVFTKEYNLLSIEEVQNHIQEKGYLPNIPSAKEMEASGVELGIMNMKLLEKIEELTLYTIEQEKQLKEQSKEIQALKKENKDNSLLEERVRNLERIINA